MLRALAVALLLASVALHWPGGRADFTFDDDDFVLTNESVRSAEAALAAFGQPFPPTQVVRGLYRPITNASYALDWARSGRNARGYHHTNVVLYGIVVLLVYALASWYRATGGFAFAVALLFAVHPAHCDAVDSISGRSEILALGFSLVSLLAFLFALRPERRPLAGRPAVGLALGVSLLAYALACLSKETGVVLPGILAAHYALFAAPGRPGFWRRGALWLAPYVAILVGYLALRVAVLGTFAPATGVLQGASVVRRLHTMGLTYFRYAELFVWPRVLQVDFYYREGFLDPRATVVQAGLGFVGVVGLAVGLAWLGQRVWRERAGGVGVEPPSRAAIGVAAFAIGACFFFPYTHLVKIGAVMAERFLFAPSLGAILGLVVVADAGLARLPPRAGRAIGAAAVVLLAVAGGVRSAQRAEEWRDDVLLWRAAVRDLPADFRVHSNLATAHMDRGELEAARPPMERAAELGPKDPTVRRNLLRLERLEAARAR